MPKPPVFLTCECFLYDTVYVCGFLQLVYILIYISKIREKNVFFTFLRYIGVILQGESRLWLGCVLFFAWITPPCYVYWVITVLRKGPPARHRFRSSFRRTAKTRVWPIRHWGGEAHSDVWYICTGWFKQAYRPKFIECLMPTPSSREIRGRPWGFARAFYIPQPNRSSIIFSCFARYVCFCVFWGIFES